MDKLNIAYKWFEEKGWKPFPFQEDSWKSVYEGENGLINAPTGSGKTYSLILPILADQHLEANKGNLCAIWITPIRALAHEIHKSTLKAIEGMGLPYTVEVRTGDTSASKKKSILSKPPTILITTPESLHLFLTYKHYPQYFSKLKFLVADEWHELLGSKRGILLELALSRLKAISPEIKIWGITATIGNMEEAKNVLLGDFEGKIIRSSIKKQIEIVSVMPDHIDSMPWAGHLGIHLLNKILPLITSSNSTLIFTNTRGQCELWYQKILNAAPELAGQIAMHHGSISSELRNWVEASLHDEKIKVVVCTSSLDLGVDFRPVERIIQIGGPKGVARFIQRAGRSGHMPGALSKIYFVPTHSLELIEAAALRKAINIGLVESRVPYRRSFDVLSQYLITLSCSQGFLEDQIFKEVKTTYAFQDMNTTEWEELLDFITTGGTALEAYDEYRKVIREGRAFSIFNKRTAFRHRMSIGTIVGEHAVQIKFKNGKYIGTVEEWFINRMMPGDTFWFAGRSLALLNYQGSEATVEPAKKKSGKVPSWQGGRMPLSGELSEVLREKINEYRTTKQHDAELQFLKPLMEIQHQVSHLPTKDEFLVEYLKSREGYHIFMYPFEGRFVHEGIASLIAYRLSQIKPITLSYAMNDYGFEILSDQEIPIYEALESDLFYFEDLKKSIEESVNQIEMAKSRFRDISAISGLIFKGMPGRKVKERHLQTSVRLLFDVFKDYQPDHILLRQCEQEVMDFQLEESRMRKTLERINRQKIVLKLPERPTPFCFPIMVDSIRERLSTEKLEDRIKRMGVFVE